MDWTTGTRSSLPGYNHSCPEEKQMLMTPRLMTGSATDVDEQDPSALEAPPEPEPSKRSRVRPLLFGGKEKGSCKRLGVLLGNNGSRTTNRLRHHIPRLMLQHMLSTWLRVHQVQSQRFRLHHHLLRLT
jgi:hypothetical protein